MRFALVNALKSDGAPLYIDGKPAGRLERFEIPRDVVVLRVPKGTPFERVRHMQKVLSQTLRDPVLIVESDIEFLVLETRFGRWWRLLRLRIAGRLLHLRERFALSTPKS